MNPTDLHLFVASSSYENDLIEEIQYRQNLTIVKKEEGMIWARGPKQVLWWPQWQLDRKSVV